MKLRVKFLSKSKSNFDPVIWLRRFPQRVPEWGNCEFCFDPNERHYDWLVAYDDLPALCDERFTLWTEKLACPLENTLLITSEPATVKIYGRAFVRQFHHALSSQEPEFLQHPRQIREQCGLIPFYGRDSERGSYDALKHHNPEAKPELFSTICSAKAQKHTLHNHRYRFTRWLKGHLPEMALFGHGFNYIEEKADAIDPYAYHLTIENHAAPHHWTEKLADAYLGLSMPIYYGCPNVGDYFPEESFIRINPGELGASLEIIRKTMRDRLHEKYRSALIEAKRRVLDEYSLFPNLARLIELHHRPAGNRSTASTHLIKSRHRLRKDHPGAGLPYLIERTSAHLRLKGRLTQLTRDWETHNLPSPERRPKSRS